jgi:hypothetical protein
MLSSRREKSDSMFDFLCFFYRRWAACVGLPLPVRKSTFIKS